VSVPVQHRLALSIVLAAVGLTAAFFAFARPRYSEPSPGRSISFAKYHAPAHGWAWADGTPGFEFGNDEEDWNVSNVRPAELRGARAAAAQAGADPRSVRPLNALRLSADDLFMLVAGADAEGRTCLGAVVATKRSSFFCPQSPRSLGPQVAFVTVAALPRAKVKAGNGHGFTQYEVFPLHLLGVVRADVKRVVVTGPRLEDAFSPQVAGWWGTFAGTPGDSYLSGRAPQHPWRARIDFYGAHELLARLPIRLDRPTSQLLEVRPRPSNE
jgi:hypothetical protein